jgi:hypothetical protein
LPTVPAFADVCELLRILADCFRTQHANVWLRFPTDSNGCQRQPMVGNGFCGGQRWHWLPTGANCSELCQNGSERSREHPQRTRERPDGPQKFPRCSTWQCLPAGANCPDLCQNVSECSKITQNALGSTQTHPRSSPEAPQTFPKGPSKVPRLGSAI